MDPKQLLREEALANRRREPGRAAKSAAIGEHIETLEACRTATLIASYVGIRDEVATRPFLERRLTQDLPTAVVYRDGGTLGLCRIHTLDELEQASFGLWEPPDDLRRDPGRSCSASDVSLFLVPGLAFDRDGGRLGYGRGYYDYSWSGPIPRPISWDSPSNPRLSLGYR